MISQSLSDLVKALKGLVVMSSELELMANSLFINAVPEMWKAKARICPPHPVSLCLVFAHFTLLFVDSLRHNLYVSETEKNDLICGVFLFFSFTRKYVLLSVSVSV